MTILKDTEDQQNPLASTSPFPCCIRNNIYILFITHNEESTKQVEVTKSERIQNHTNIKKKKWSCRDQLRADYKKTTHFPTAWTLENTIDPQGLPSHYPILPVRQPNPQPPRPVLSRHLVPQLLPLDSQ